MKNYQFLQWTIEEIKIVILSVLLYVSSYLLDFRIFGDFLFLFPRSGALVVCLGIWFGLLNLPYTLDNVLKIQNDKSVKLFDEALIMTRGHPEEIELNKESYQAASDDFSGNRETNEILKKRVLYIEFYLLIGGTLVWAFGDLIVRYSL